MSELMQVTGVSISGKRRWEIRNNHGSIEPFPTFSQKWENERVPKAVPFDSRQTALTCEEKGSSGRVRDECLYLAELCSLSPLGNQIWFPWQLRQRRQSKKGGGRQERLRVLFIFKCLPDSVLRKAGLRLCSRERERTLLSIFRRPWISASI